MSEAGSGLRQGSWRRPEGLWIAMEYCGGGSVADLMQAADAPLDEEVIAWLCCETLAGLAYLHSMGKVLLVFLSLLLPSPSPLFCQKGRIVCQSGEKAAGLSKQTIARDASDESAPREIWYVNAVSKVGPQRVRSHLRCGVRGDWHGGGRCTGT